VRGLFVPTLIESCGEENDLFSLGGLEFGIVFSFTLLSIAEVERADRTKKKEKEGVTRRQTNKKRYTE
jgi:hypothetical protein